MDKELDEEQEMRRARRLREHLGLDDDAVEVVLYMRHRLVEMQREMRALELELNRHRHRHTRRMESYRVYYEASWRELDSEDK